MNDWIACDVCGEELHDLQCVECSALVCNGCSEAGVCARCQNGDAGTWDDIEDDPDDPLG